MRLKARKEVVHISGKKHALTTIHDHKGKVYHKSLFSLEFGPKDMLQVIIGASILAIPVGYTEETWQLGQILPFSSILAFLIFSLLFIAAFVFYHYYKDHTDWPAFFKRVILTYALAFLVVALLLTIIQRTPWAYDPLLSFKRTVIVAFPASLSGAIADVLK